MFIPLAPLRRKPLASRLLSFGALLVLAGSRAAAQTSAGALLYSHGNPTDQEQYLLEQLNRARLDPAAEGRRMADWLRNDRLGKVVALHFSLNPDAVGAQIAAFPAVQPLAFNVELLAVATAHTRDIASHNGVGPGTPPDPHNGYDGSIPYSRVQSSHYAGDYAGENFCPGMGSTDIIHASYFVDWGNPGLGHLQNCLQGGDTREVGMGLVSLSGGTNPVLEETEDYGSAGDVLTSKGPIFADAPALLVGVAYADANGNGQYDAGEGLAGVTVTMDGGRYYAVTGASGGYALPLVNADGSFHDGAATVRMDGSVLHGARLAAVTVNRVGVPGNPASGTYRANVKWDAVVSQSAGGEGGTGLVPPADGSTLLALKGGGIVSKAAGSKVAVTVQRAAKDLSQPLTVAYKTKGTAVAGVDYKPLPGSVTIPAGADHAAFKVKALKNGVAVGSATLTLRAAKAAGVAVQAGEGKATVLINP